MRLLFGGVEPEPADGGDEEGGDEGGDGGGEDPADPQEPGSDPYGMSDGYAKLMNQIVSLKARIGDIDSQISQINDMIIPNLQGAIDAIRSVNAGLELEIQGHIAALQVPGYDDERRLHLQAIEGNKRQIALNNREINKLQVQVLTFTRIAAQTNWHLLQMRNRLQAELEAAEIALSNLISEASMAGRTE